MEGVRWWRRATALLALAALVLLLGPVPRVADAAADRRAPECAGQPVVGLVVAVRGQARRFFLCQNGVRGPAPLVVVVHGWTTSPRTFEAVAQWSRLGVQRHFVTAYPAGTGSSWDAGGCCGVAARRHVDDVDLFDALVASVRRRGPVTTAYYAGFSNGAMLGFRLECGDRGPFRAFVGVAGTGALPACRPRHERPLLSINGLADGLVPYRGCTTAQPGTGCAERLHVDLAPVPTVLRALRTAAGCRGTVRSRAAPHVVLERPTGCRSPSVTEATVDDLDHAWPRDATRYGWDATAAAWAFLSAH